MNKVADLGPVKVRKFGWASRSKSASLLSETSSATEIEPAGLTAFSVDGRPRERLVLVDPKGLIVHPRSSSGNGPTERCFNLRALPEIGSAVNMGTDPSKSMTPAPASRLNARPGDIFKKDYRIAW